ncbi:MAG: hypothetical protein NT015_01845 [Alphaproteobacteria bacterium]|nr:hypothetical protein [Alphaproteobacteria bacterium]
MVVTLFPLLVGGIAFVFAIYGKQRFALGTLLAGPILMLALCVAIWVSTELNPCEPQPNCHAGDAMAVPFAALVGLAWVAVAGLGWYLGWTARRISRASGRNRDSAP